MPRRATAIAQLVKENPNTIIVDSGNLTDGSPQKLDVIASALVKMGYSAVGLGDRDAQLGDQFYSKAKAQKLTIVDTSPVADKSAVPFVLKTVGGIKVGILSFGALPPSVTVDDMTMRKMRFVALKEARAKSDVLILLDQAGVANREWIERNGPRLGAPDIVIRGFRDDGHDGQEEVVANAHLMPSLFQGKEIGVIDLQVTPGQEAKTDFNRITLNEKYAEDPDILKQVNDGVAAMGVQPVDGPLPEARVIGQTRPYYSPNLCKACHLKQYEDWSKTQHSVALKTLVDAKHTTPDCLPCHSERYRAARQFTTDNPVAGVECATCHAASLPHGMERSQMTARTKVEPLLCVQCHTKERSPGFDQAIYFAKVAHSSTTAPTTAASVPPSAH